MDFNPFNITLSRSRLAAYGAEIVKLSAELVAVRAALAEARKDRASIVAWVAGEGDRFRRAMSDGVGGDDRRERLAALSGLCFTLSSQIARGDDKVGEDRDDEPGTCATCGGGT